MPVAGAAAFVALASRSSRRTSPRRLPRPATSRSGKEVFASAGCGSCHSLADAGATGHDRARASMPRDRLPALVADRVRNGQGAMPAFAGTLSEAEIADVAAYVAEAASG